MKSVGLLSPYKLGTIDLKNRIVMAPMTRSRATNNLPNALMAKFYEQRAAAGLIITEGTSPSPNGVGYSRIPGIFNNAQVEGWKETTQAVHAAGGAIFLQLMHTGRISHRDNMSDTAVIIAPSAIKPSGTMWTDTLGLQEYPLPLEMDTEEISSTRQEFITAAINAIHAGFNGVEFHGANGYLLEQFLSPVSNTRTDLYGGTIENRCRFLLEILQCTADSIGRHSVGIRLSPYGIANDMPHYPEIEQTYHFLAEQIERIGIQYINIVDHHSMGAPEVPLKIKNDIRNRFHGTLILGGGYTLDQAHEDVKIGLADLIAFGRPFINNPDLVERFSEGRALSEKIDTETFYTVGEKGYTDYPVYKET
jgi:N-ethylmaleimide reductase